MLRKTGLALFLLVLAACKQTANVRSDNFMALEIKQAIEQSDEQLQKPQSYIKVAHKNGLVLLLGNTTSTEMQELAYRTAAEFEGVDRVYSEIQVNGESAGIAGVSDGIITTRLKAQLLNVEGLSPNQLKVVTDKGIVYLIGHATRQQADDASNKARGIGGVQKVVRVIDYSE